MHLLFMTLYMCLYSIEDICIYYSTGNKMQKRTEYPHLQNSKNPSPFKTYFHES